MASNKTVLVTGGANGIGAATVNAFAQAGYDVAINYHTSKDDAYILAKKCTDLGIRAVPIQADVSNEKDVIALADRIRNEFGRLDVLVNNAGKAQEPKLEVITKAEILTTLSNSLVSTILMTQAFVPELMTNNAVVLNVATIYGLDQSGSTGLPVYSTAKAGVINFTQTMAKKYAPKIRFNVVVPGFTKTPHWDPISDKVKKECIDSTLQKEWVQPEDIAEALLFLVNAKHINSQTITIDAGWSKR